MTQEIDAIVDTAIRYARSRQAVVVDLPHVALAILDLAREDGEAGIRLDTIEAAAATADSLRSREESKDSSWSQGVVPVSSAFRSWLRSMEALAQTDDPNVLLKRASERLGQLFGPVPQQGRSEPRPGGRRNLTSGMGSQPYPPYVFEFTPEILERFDPYIDNEDLIRLTLGVLARPKKRNPVLVGPAGVGKTALVVEVARRLNQDRVPARLEGSRVFQVDLGTAVAGTRYRGDFEERMAWLSRRLLEDPKSIFFIDEVHLVLSVGSAEGGIDAASLLKPALSTGVGALIGATTREQAQQLERDAPLARRLVFIPVVEPSVDRTRTILESYASTLEAEFSIEIPDRVIEAALQAGARLRPYRHLPDAAIDILDLAASLFAVDDPEQRTLTVDATEFVAEFITEGLAWVEDSERAPLLRVRDRVRSLIRRRYSAGA